MLIKMSEFGSSLCTRSSGRDVYNQVAKELAADNKRVVFDFENVTSVTNSFADEVFGRLALDVGLEPLKRQTSFINIEVFPAKVIRTAIDNRTSRHLVEV